MILASSKASFAQNRDALTQNPPDFRQSTRGLAHISGGLALVPEDFALKLRRQALKLPDLVQNRGDQAFVLPDFVLEPGRQALTLAD